MTTTIRHTGAGFNSAATGYVARNGTAELDDDVAERFVADYQFEYADADESDEAADADAGDPTPDSAVAQSPTQAAIEAASYRELQQVAAELDGVAANQNTDDLRAELYDHPDSDALAAAVAAVEDPETETEIPEE